MKRPPPPPKPTAAHPPEHDTGRPSAGQLRQIRRFVEAVRRPGAGVSAADLVQLSQGLDHSLTIDFDAAEELGQPLVVLRAASATGQAACFSNLTAREREVAGLLAAGLRNRDIAGRLYISVATVKDHVHKVLSKSGLSSRTEVARVWLTR